MSIPPKRIAILNLQVDANYGGHLQRYALIKTLQRMGYDVTHLNTRFPSSKKSWLKYLKGGAKRLLFYPLYVLKKSTDYLPLRYFKYYIKHESITEVFYDKYIPHTPRIYSYEELKQNIDFDCFMVGSDQVWRKSHASIYGIYTYLFDYLPVDKCRIAYGASMGTDRNELDDEDIIIFGKLYARFKAVSVREESGLQLLRDYGCECPKAMLVLDPTLLLYADDYSKLIADCDTLEVKDDIFCYILDKDDEKLAFIDHTAKERNMTYTIWDRDLHYSVEQWLRSIRDAKLIITDSYHGMLFSIIFNKPFNLLKNDARGNARFDSVAKMLGVDIGKEQQDYAKIIRKIEDCREKSLRYIENSLKE